MNGPTASLGNMATDMALLPLQEVKEYQNRQRPFWIEARSQDLFTTALLFEYKRTSWHYDITDDGTFRKLLLCSHMIW